MAKANVTIYADNKMQQGLKGAESSLSSFQKYVQGIGDKVKGALSMATIATAVVAALGKITKAAKECVNAFTEADKVSQRLTAVWANVGSATGKTSRQMDDLAESLEKVTYFQSESIKEAGILLAATESLTEEGFDRAMQASLDLAAALGQDVSSAASLLAKAMEAPEEAFKSLKSIGVAFTNDEKEQIKTLAEANKQMEAQELILSKIEQRYKGVAQAIADTPAGKLDAIKDTIGDIKEGLGEALVNSLSPAFSWILKVLQKIHDWVSGHNEETKLYSMLEGSGTYKELANQFTGEKLNEALTEQQANFRTYIENFSKSTNWGTALSSRNISLASIVSRSDGEVRALFERYFGKSEETDQLIASAIEDLNLTFRPMVTWQKKLYDAIDYQTELYSLPTADRSTQYAETISSALEDMIKKYGSNSDTYVVGNLQKDIEAVRKLLDGSVEEGSEDHEILNEILLYLEEQLPKDMTSFGSKFAKSAMAGMVGSGWNQFALDSWFGTVGPSGTLNAMQGTIGINATTMDQFMIATGNWVEAVQDLNDIYGKGSGTSFGKFGIRSDFGFQNTQTNFTDTMSILGPEVINKFLDFGKNSIDDILKDLGKYSKSYSRDSVAKDIAELRSIIASSIEPGSPLWTYFEEILDGLEESARDNRTFLEKFADNIGEAIHLNFESITSKQGSAFAGSVITSFTSSLGEAGEVVGTLANNMAQMGPVLGAIATALKYVFEGMAQVIGPIFNDLIQYGIEPLRELGRVIGKLLLPILETVMPLVKDSAESFVQVFNGIGAALKPIMTAIANVIAPIIQLIANTLKFIEPIITAIAYVLATVSGIISYIVQALTHWVALFLNWIAGLNLFGWRPFEGLAIEDPGSPGDFWKYMGDVYGEIDEALNNTSAVDTIGTQQAVSQASYRGATSVTINIYAEGPIVGDGGMRQFASMIREEFQALDYYGVN